MSRSIIRQTLLTSTLLSATWLSPPPAQAAYVQREGTLSLLRVHDVGSGYGPSYDFIDVEVVIAFRNEPGKAYGFRLRNDLDALTHQAMLDLLRDAFENGWSVVINAEIPAGKDKLDAIISAGNTGAFAASCQLRIKPITGVSRAGIAVVMPTFHGPVLICDVGANVAPKPRHLYEYARMCAAYAETILGIPEPAIGLVSIGEEADLESLS